jgi:hypothetical protein
MNSIVATLVFGAMAYLGLVFATDYPEGYYSARTGECIGVITPDGVADCKVITVHEKVVVSDEVTFAHLQAKYGKLK